MDSHYKAISTRTDTTGVDNLEPSYKHSSGRRPWIWHVVSHFLSLLWLAPAIFLLYINITHRVIGNTLWCPSGHCNVVGNGANSVKDSLKYDRDDHNVNGALLFVQKAVEVWFTVIATLLVYDIAMMLARREGGLPIGYLLAHLEFTDPLNLLNTLTWTSASSKRSNNEGSPNDGHPPRVTRFILFAMLVTFLTIVANLMGPAGGVLVLPTVQWVDTDYKLLEQFQVLLSADSPSGDTTFANCTSADLGRGNFRCTSYRYAPMLESIISSIITSNRQNSTTSVVASEQNVRFSFDNSSFSQPNLLFIPNRQVMSSLSSLVFNDESDFKVKPRLYNDSIQTTAHRSGPLIGSFFGLGVGDITIINITDNKQVRCIEQWFDPSTPDITYIKCIRQGKGWSGVNAERSFSFSNSTSRGEKESADDILINIYFSDKATYSTNDTDHGSGLLACAKSSFAKCNWDSIFAADLPLNLSRIATNSLIVETSERRSKSSGFWADATSYPSTVDYQLDLSPYTILNPLIDTINASVPNAKNTAPLVINPDWVLAAWSVNNTGVIDGTSSLGLMISSAIRDMSNDGLIGNNILLESQIYATAHALTLIPYNIVGQSSPTGFSNGQISENIPLYFWRSRRVWLYSLSSRTAIVGAVIITIGMIIVLMRTLLAIYEKLVHNYATRAHSPTEILVASLAHHPEGEFDHLTNESACAQVRFRVDDDGKFLTFRPQKTKSS